MAVNRVTGLNSGLDTESLVTSLVANYQKKVDNLKGQQERHQWKTEAWQAMNKKVVSFYNGQLGTMRWAESFSKKLTTSTNASAVSIVTGSTAMNATQKMKVNKVASSAYMSGGKVKDGTKGSTKLSELTDFGTATRQVAKTKPHMVEKQIQDSQLVYTTADDEEGMEWPEGSGEYVKKGEDGNPLTGLLWEDDEKTIPKMITALDPETNEPIMEQAKDEDGNLIFDPVLDDDGNQVYEDETYIPGKTLTFKVGEKEVSKEFGEGSTINDVLTWIKGINENGQKFNANFDEGNGRIYVAANTTGEAGTFSISGDDALLSALGFKAAADPKSPAENEAVYAEGSDAEIELNGATYKSAKGTFEINGLTITANEVTDDYFTITTKTDTSGIYDMVKKFFSDYNDLIKEIDTKYNADDSSKYDMLTDDEKYSMSDKQVEEWETKIKDGLLRRDETLYTVQQALKDIMNKSYEVTNSNGQKVTLNLSSFGINTLGYFEADKNERGVFHIDGDPDDDKTSNNEDKLRAMIASDPDAVSNFFVGLARDMYNKLFDLMKSTDYSSSFTLYEDKLMATQYSSYTDKITSATETLNAKEDKYYKQFAKMETAMSKINSTQSQLSGYFGS